MPAKRTGRKITRHLLDMTDEDCFERLLDVSLRNLSQYMEKLELYDIWHSCTIFVDIKARGVFFLLYQYISLTSLSWRVLSFVSLFETENIFGKFEHVKGSRQVDISFKTFYFLPKHSKIKTHERQNNCKLCHFQIWNNGFQSVLI